MTILAMMAAFASKRISDKDRCSNKCFEDFVQSRGRAKRTGSLALPDNSLLDLNDEQQEQCNSLALIPPNTTIRRHSSHCCPTREDKPVAPITLNFKPQTNLQPQSIPPPVPKRTFKGKIVSKQNNTGSYSSGPQSSNLNRESNLPPYNFSIMGKPFSAKDIPDISTQYVDVAGEQISDDDRISLENSVFDEQRTDLCAMNNSRQSVRSSSDSNKSQITTDTGYMSNENEKSYQPDSRNCRSRFSSADTQSSLDSCLTEKTIDSPLSKESFKMDTGRQPMNDYSPSKASKNLPAVPARKQSSAVPPKIPPPAATGKLRPIPPAPPTRTQRSQELPNLIGITNDNNSKQLQDTDDNISNASKSNNYQDNYSKPTAIRTKFARNNKPPPIMYPRLHKRQDSNISSDSLSATSSPGYNTKSVESTILQLSSSPGYNTKSMEAPLLQHASKINRSGIRHQDSNDSFVMTRFNLPPNKMNYRQDSSVSSDSFSQISSPGYNSKLMEAPLLLQTIKINNLKQSFKTQSDVMKNQNDQIPTSPITKSASTPASLQTIVRFQNGSNMSLQHRIINRRKSSNHYITPGCPNFRLIQIVLNALALIAIAGGFAAYFNAYPNVKFINRTIITPQRMEDHVEINKNPAPGICLPIIVKFCQNHQVSYNYTVFPNYIGHFGQLEAQSELEAYDALVDVRCYELVSLFLCSLFVPKCGPSGNTVPPCKSLCTETMNRCGFFFDVFGLGLPEYLTCNLLMDFNNPDECVGKREVDEAKHRARNPVCSGFLCDQDRCIPSDWRCDGHVDCEDQTDESECEFCGKGSIYCGQQRCMSQKHICDGIVDCPYGQDEGNCLRLSERNGDLGKGTLEVYKADVMRWTPACVTHWDFSTSPSAVCSLLGYSSVNSSKLTKRGSNLTMTPPVNETPSLLEFYRRKQSNLIKEFSSCAAHGDYPVVELTCTNFECGKIRNRKYKPSKRIVGGSISSPGDWPFLVAILGGPKEIFYCAGVLIADQWVLTASHCIGNHTLRNINDWTIQLGVTRRHSHNYYAQKVKVRNVIPHPQYNSFIAHDNDIALFQLATRVAFHKHLLPVCLPPPGVKELKPGTRCTVIGWGKREDKSLNPDAASASYEPTVNEVEVPVLDRDVCNEWLDTPNVTLGMICAGYKEGGKDACQGDSGGPLLCQYPGERDRWFVGGIVSWGIMCAHPKLPGVYANVPRYVPWITQQINKYSK